MQVDFHHGPLDPVPGTALQGDSYGGNPTASLIAAYSG
jgi:hypothetical protein